MYKKHFEEWSQIKQKIDDDEKMVFIRAGEIRWMILGVNVGSEMDGKGASFTRPVLVLHVVGKKLALIAPLSTKMKDAPGYIVLDWKKKKNSLCIHQMKVVSQKRMLNRIGKISENKLQNVKNEIKHFYDF